MVKRVSARGRVRLVHPVDGVPLNALERFRDTGATEFCFDFMPETKETALDTLERFAQEVRPKLD